MSALGVAANYVKYLAAMATAVPAYVLSAAAVNWTLEGPPFRQMLDPWVAFGVMLVLAQAVWAVQFGLALRLGPGGSRGVAIWFSLWAGAFAALALMANLFAGSPEDARMLLSVAALAIIGAFVARLMRPRRVTWGRVALIAAVWVPVLAVLPLLVQAGEMSSRLHGLMVLGLIATLGFVPMVRMERAP